MPTIVKNAQINDIKPELLVSLIFVESSFNYWAVSHAGACGLTQVLPKYTGKITKKYTCEQLKVPRNSIYVGAKTLRFWINHHDDISRGLCGYNAGFRCSYRRNKKGKIVKRPNKYGMRYARKVQRISKRILNESIRIKRERHEEQGR